MKHKIMLVDDEDLILEFFQQHLRPHFQVYCATSAADGLHILETSGPFAVVVSDWKMANTDGVRFLGEVMLRAPETTRIMLSAYAGRRLAVDAINQGHLFRFLVKPCGTTELYRAIEAGIEAHCNSCMAQGIASA